MTTPPTFPTLAGQGWSVHKKPTFSTLTASHVSGREVRDARYLNPIWRFELTFDGLDGAPAAAYGGLGAQSLQALMGFFLQAQGQFGAFLLVDPTDNSVSNQAIGTGDGATTAFTFQRTLGGFNEPVGWVTNTSYVLLNGVFALPGGTPAPLVPAVSTVAGGSLAGATYYAGVTYVTASGETTPSPIASLAVGANNLLKVTSPVTAQGVIGYNVYARTSGTLALQNATPIAIGANWTEPTSGLVAGVAPPLANTTGYTVTAPNTLTFGGAPQAGVIVTATFAYAFLCRFDGDDLDFEQFMSNLWRAQSVTFRSLRAQ